MKNKKSIIDEFISLISKRYKSLEKQFDERSDMQDDLSLLSGIFREDDSDDFDYLSNLSSEEFQKVISILIKEDEIDLENNLRAIQFLLNNGVPLVESQTEKLRDLNYRANLKIRNLKRSIATREKNIDEYETYSELEKQLYSLKTEGLFDSKTIKTIFLTLKINEEDQNKYLDRILAFNKSRFESIVKGTSIQMGESIELLEVDDILEIKPKLSLDDLKSVFEKHNYDLSMLSEDLIELLTSEGDAEKIESVLSSIDKNGLNFVKKDSSLLVSLLLQSSGELIDEGCKVFRDARVDLRFLKNYIAIFFPSREEVSETEEIFKKKTVHRNVDIIDSEDNNAKRKNIPGRHKDLPKNLELLKSMGYDTKHLLERNIALLTLPHHTVIRHLKELELYEFPVHSGRFPLSALSSYRIMSLADEFIELGEESYILENASRLATCQEGTTERLYALKKNGLQYMIEVGNGKKLLSYVTNPRLSCGLSPDEIDGTIPHDADKILNGNKFNDLLDDYVPMKISDETLESPFVKQLDERYMHSNLSYNINGVLISRKKFLRNYEFLMTTDLIPQEEKDTEQIALVSAIYKSKLSIEEIEKVNNGLNSCMVIGGGNNGLLKK